MAGSNAGMARNPVWLGVVALMAISLGGTVARAHFTGETAHDELARLAAQEVAAERAAVVRVASVRDTKIPPP